MPEPDKTLRVVNVMDPMMCLRCSNAHIAEVLFTDGSIRRMFYCSRLDCDNWCWTKISKNGEERPVEDGTKKTSVVEQRKYDEVARRLLG